MEGNTKSCDQFKRGSSFNDSSFFKWLQLNNAIPSNTKKNCSNTSNNLIYLNHHLISGNRLLKLEKLKSKEL